MSVPKTASGGIRPYARCPHGTTLTQDGLVLKAGDRGATEYRRVWGPGVNNTTVFAEGCAHVLDACLEGAYPKGGFGAIITHGLKGAGKTFTLLCPSKPTDSIAAKCCSYLFTKGVTSLKIQVCEIMQEMCFDLLTNHGKTQATKFGVKVAVDDRLGAVIEAETETCRTVDSSVSVLRRALDQRVRSDSHFVAMLTIQKGTGTVGRLFLIDCAHCSHLPTMGKSPAELEAAAALSKSHQILSQCMAGMASRKDYRVLPFRDSKLTRILQHPLYYASHGKGHVSVLTHFSNNTDDAEDTLALLLSSGLLSSKKHMKTISEYKDSIRALESRIVDVETRLHEAERKTEATGKLRKIRRKAFDSLGETLKVKENDLGARVSKLKQDLAKEYKHVEVKHMDELRERITKSRKEYALTQQMINGVGNAVDAYIEQMEKDHLAARVEYRRNIDQRVMKEKQEADRLTFELNEKRMKAERLQAWEAKVRREIEQLDAEEKKLQEKAAKATGPSRSAGLTPEELTAKSEYFRLLDEVDDLQEGTDNIRNQIRAMKSETHIDVPTDSDDSDAATEEEKTGDSSHTPPPSSPPSSEIATIPTEQDEEEELPSESSNFGDSPRGEEERELATKTERQQLAFTLQKEENLHVLVGQIMHYLEFGTSVSVVQLVSPPVIRRFVFLGGTDRKELRICEPDPATGQATDKAHPLLALPLKEVKSIALGQLSEPFNILRARRQAEPALGHPPPNSQGLAKDPGSVQDYFYRSIVLHLKSGQSLSFVAETDVDFEAWVVALHRITRLTPAWSTHLAISQHPGVSKLSEQEAKFCSENHITPLNFANAKYQILNRKRLLTTLYDVRTASSLDLMHSQNLFELLCESGHIERTTLWVVKAEAIVSDDDPPAGAGSKSEDALGSDGATLKVPEKVVASSSENILSVPSSALDRSLNIERFGASNKSGRTGM